MASNKKRKLTRKIQGIVKLSWQVSEYLASKGSLDLYVAWAILKGKHRNSRFYNYTINKVATTLQCSHAKAKRVLKELKSLGLVEVKDNILFIKPNKVFAETLGIERMSMYEVDTRSNARCEDLFHYVRDQVRKHLLSSSYNRNKYRAKGNDSHTMLTEVNAIASGTTECHYLRFVKGKLQISYEGIGKLLGISKTNAYNVVVRWIKEDYLSKQNCKLYYPNVGRAEVDVFRKNESSNWYYCPVSEMGYQVKPNLYTFVC